MTVALLTSQGLTPSPTMNRFLELKAALDLKTCGLIYNAAGDPASKYVSLARQQLESTGIRVTFVDARMTDIETYDMLYIAGGNTFRLLEDIRQGVGVEKLKEIIHVSRLVIGVSAGAVVLTPTIRVVSQIQPDDNLTKTEDYSGLNMLDYEILPHYSDSLLKDTLKYQTKYQTKLATCTDSGFIETNLAGHSQR